MPGWCWKLRKCVLLFSGEKKSWNASDWKGHQESNLLLKVSTELRSNCSGLCPIGFWKPQRMESALPLWEMSSTASLSIFLQCFCSPVSFKDSYSFSAVYCSKEPGSISSYVLDGRLLGPSNPSRLNKPQSWFSFQRKCFRSLKVLVALHWTWSSLSTSFLSWQTQSWAKYPYMV